MKTRLRNLFLLSALIGVPGLILACQATAQTFTTLYSFTATAPNTGNNSDGAIPEAGLILSGNTLYGTADGGGDMDAGTVFALNTDDGSFTTVWRFTSSDGVEPVAAVTLSGNTLYGTTTFSGGPNEEGAVFSVQTSGGPYTALHNFTLTLGSGGAFGTNSDGAIPEAGLILSSNTLYGTAFAGGSSGWGTVFAINLDSLVFTNLHTFTGGSNGANPYAGLILSGNTLYGTTSGDFVPSVQSGFGTVFAINTDGSNFTTLYSFTNGSDGSQPFGGLVLSDNVLYGTTYLGGSAGNGTVFSVNTDGIGFAILNSFTNESDGANPYAGLILSGNFLYGTTTFGGSANSGTVFSVSTNGSNLTTLHSFTARVYDGISAYTNSDGNSPKCALILAGNTLYGTAERGGLNGNGTIFGITLPAPQLTLMASGTNLIITWPTNYAGFDDSGYTLQSTTDLLAAFWTTNSPAPVVANGQNTVTNPISGTQQFFRLSQ